MLNKKYGRLIDNELQFAEYPLVTSDGKQVYSDSAVIYLQNGWKKIIESGPKTYHFTITEEEDTITIHYEQSIEDIRQLKLSDLEIYDTSDEVDGFLVGDHHMWLDGLERCKLEQGIKDCMALGRETYGLCIPGVGVVDLPCDTILDMLAQLNVYAVDCFKTTFLHEEAIKGLSTIEEIEAYDFTTGYPPKLSFPII